MTKKDVIYIGFTGPMGSGKGAAIEEFHNSLSHIVRAEATERGIEHTRDNLIDLGNKLRDEQGLGVFGARTAEKLNANKYTYVIIDGIRHPKEVRALRKGLENFVLIAVTAEDEIRYQRILSRQRPSDVKDLESFDEKAALKKIKEKGLKDRAIGIDKCIEMADYVIHNDYIKLTKLRKIVRDMIDSYSILVSAIAQNKPHQ